MQVQNLKNNGTVFFNLGKSKGEEKTIIVVGLARSGTTFVTQCLRSIDLFIGNKIDDSVLEDVEISSILEAKGDLEQEVLEGIIEKRNREYPNWCFKRPQAYRYMLEYDRFFRNTHYIVTFRDTLAIAMRNKISINTNIITNLENSCYHLIELIHFIKKIERPTLLMSYEKAITENSNFNSKLLEFLKLPETATNTNKLEKCLNLNSQDYLMKSRIHKIVGRLDGLRDEKSILKGWAKYMDKEDVVKLKLFVNNKLIDTIEANESRDDLTGKGNCAFTYDIMHLKNNFTGTCQIRVVTEKGNFELNNSPLIVKF